MAGRYPEATDLFLQERKLLLDDLSDDMYKKAIEAFTLANDLMAVQEVEKLLELK